MDLTIWIDDIKIEKKDKKAINKKNSKLAKLMVCEIGLYSGKLGDQLLDDLHYIHPLKAKM